MTEYFFRDGEPVGDLPVTFGGKSHAVKKALRQKPCKRCTGTGTFTGWGRGGSRCRPCEGSGKLHAKEETVYTSGRLAKLNLAQNVHASNKQDDFYREHRELIVAIDAGKEGSTFLRSLTEQLIRRGSLTDRQLATARLVIKDRAATARVNEERDPRVANSEHLGGNGMHLWVNGTIHRKRQGNYEWWYIIDTTSGNVVTYSGSCELGSRGDRVRFKCTVKGHSEYRGVKQTQVNRPRRITIDPTGKAASAKAVVAKHRSVIEPAIKREDHRPYWTTPGYETEVLPATHDWCDELHPSITEGDDGYRALDI